MSSKLLDNVHRVRANPVYRNAVTAFALVGVVVIWSPFRDEWLDVTVAGVIVGALALLGWLDLRDAWREEQRQAPKDPPDHR